MSTESHCIYFCIYSCICILHLTSLYIIICIAFLVISFSYSPTLYISCVDYRNSWQFLVFQ